MIPFIHSHILLCFIAAFAVIVFGDLLGRLGKKSGPLLTVTVLVTATLICSLAGYAILSADGLTGPTVTVILSVVFGAVAAFSLAITEGGLGILLIKVSGRIRERAVRGEIIELKNLRDHIEWLLGECREDLNFRNSGLPLDVQYLNGKKAAYEETLRHIDFIIKKLS